MGALNLRAEPVADAKILAVLKAGAVVTYDPFSVGRTRINGVNWVKVRAEDADGWIEGEYIMPRYIYAAYREAIRLGKAGDAAGMITAIRTTADGLGQDADDVVPSPDGRKVVVDTPGDVMYNPYFGDIGTLYFEAGKGLARFGFDLEAEGVWSPDSRYFAHTRWAGYGWPSFFLFDTVTNVEEWLGGTCNAATIEYVDGYFVWLNSRNNEPELAAYELATGETTVLLKGDDTTLRRNSQGIEELKLVPAGPCPPPLKGSRLYEKFNGAYVTCDDFGA